MNPFLTKEIVKELNELKMFYNLHLNFDAIEWDNGADNILEALHKLRKKI